MGNMNSTAQEIKDAQDAFSQALANAKNALNSSISRGSAYAVLSLSMQMPSVADDQNLIDAQKQLQNILNNPNSTKSEIDAAIAAFESALSKAQKQVADLKQTGKDLIANIPKNVADDVNLQSMQNALQKLLDDPNANETQLRDAISNFNKALSNAQSKLADAKSAAQDLLNNISSNLTGNSTTASIIKALEKILANPNATASEIDAILNNLETVINSSTNGLNTQNKNDSGKAKVLPPTIATKNIGNEKHIISFSAINILLLVAIKKRKKKKSLNKI
jgi:chromosome segregation ATPase